MQPLNNLSSLELVFPGVRNGERMAVQQITLQDQHLRFAVTIVIPGHEKLKVLEMDEERLMIFVGKLTNYRRR